MLHIVQTLTQHTRRIRVAALALCLLLGVVLTPMTGLVLPTKADATTIPTVVIDHYGNSVRADASLNLTDKLQVGETYTLTALWKNVSGSFSLNVYGSAIDGAPDKDSRKLLMQGASVQDVEGLTYDAKTSVLTYTFTAVGTSLTVFFYNKTNTSVEGEARLARTTLKKADGTVVYEDTPSYTSEQVLNGIGDWSINTQNDNYCFFDDTNTPDFFFAANYQWLSGLSVEAKNGTAYALDREFDLWTTDYSVTVPHGTTEVTVTPTVPVPDTGSAVVTGGSGLKDGDNLVQILATSAAGDVKVYNLTVKVIPQTEAITRAAQKHVKFTRNAVTAESLLAAVQAETGIEKITVSDFAIVPATPALTDTDTESGFPYVSEGTDGAVSATFTVGDITVPFGYAFENESETIDVSNVAVAGSDDGKLVYDKNGFIVGVQDGVDKVVVPSTAASTIRPSFSNTATYVPVMYVNNNCYTYTTSDVDYFKYTSDLIEVEKDKIYTVSALWKSTSGTPNLTVYGSAVGAPDYKNNVMLMDGNTAQSGVDYTEGRVTYEFTAQDTELYILMHFGTPAKNANQGMQLGDVTVTDEQGNVVFAPTPKYDANSNLTALEGFTCSKTVAGAFATYLKFGEQPYSYFGAEAPAVEDYTDEWNKVKVVMLENGITPVADTFAVSDGKWTALQAVKLPGDTGVNLLPEDTAYTFSLGFACALAAVNEQVNKGITDTATIAANAKTALAARAWSDAATTAFTADTFTISVAEPTLGHTVKEWAVTVSDGTDTATGIATIPAVTESMMTYMSEKKNPITKDDFLPSVMYVKDGKPDDWMFDTFVFSPANTTHGEDRFGSIDGVHGYAAMTKEQQVDWIENYIFMDGFNVDALDAAVGEAKEQLGDPTYKANVFLTVFRPTYCPTVHKGGWFDAEHTIDIRTQRGREQAVEWMVDAYTEAFNAKNYQNVRLGGFYWMAESIYSDVQGVVFDEKTLPTAQMNYHYDSANNAYRATVDGLTPGETYTLTLRYKRPNGNPYIKFNDTIELIYGITAKNDAKYDATTSLLTYTFVAEDTEITLLLDKGTKAGSYVNVSVADLKVYNEDNEIVHTTEGVYDEDGNLVGLSDWTEIDTTTGEAPAKSYICFNSSENTYGVQTNDGKERPISSFEPTIPDAEGLVATVPTQVVEDGVCKGCTVDGATVAHNEGQDELVIDTVNQYVEDKGYSMMFCLYSGAEGFEYMATYGIDYPSYQPNYFNGDDGDTDAPYRSMASRVELGFYRANKYSMAVEIEIGGVSEASIAANNEYLRLAIKGGEYNEETIAPVVDDYHNWYIGHGPAALRQFKESRMDSARRTYDNFYRFITGILTEDDLIVPRTDTVKQAAEEYILANGNDITVEALTAVIQSIEPDAVINDSYVKYSTPSATDTDKASDYKLDIKGTDGAVYLDVTVTYQLPYKRTDDSVGTIESYLDRESRFTMALVLPSEQEVIDVDTVAVAGADRGLLTYDTDGVTIIGANEAVDKIVIPEGYTGTIARTDSTGATTTNNFKNVKVLVINNTANLPSRACQGWSSLRAVQFSREHEEAVSIVGTGEILFYGCSNLRFVQLPEKLAQVSSTAWNNAVTRMSFQNCTSLETVVWHNEFAGKYLGGNQTFDGTGLLEVVAPAFKTMTEADLKLESNKVFTNGPANRHYYGSDTELTFPMAVAWAGSAVSEAIAEGYDSEQSLIRAKEILSERAWSYNVQAYFEAAKLSYNGDWLTATGTQHARLTVEILGESADVSITRAVDSTSAIKDALKNTIQDAADAFVQANGNATNEENLLAALKEATGRDDITLSDFAMSYARDAVTDTDTQMPYVVDGVDGAVYAKLDMDGISMTLVSVFPCEKVVIETNNVAIAGKDDDKLIYADNENKTGNIIGVADGVDKVIVPEYKAYVYDPATWTFQFKHSSTVITNNSFTETQYDRYYTPVSLTQGTEYTFTAYWNDAKAGTDAQAYLKLGDVELIRGNTKVADGVVYDEDTKKLTYVFTPSASSVRLSVHTNVTDSETCRVYLSSPVFTAADNTTVSVSADTAWQASKNGTLLYDETVYKNFGQKYYNRMNYLPKLDTDGNEIPVTSTIDPLFYGPVGAQTEVATVYFPYYHDASNYARYYAKLEGLEIGKTYTLTALWKFYQGTPAFSIYGNAVGVEFDNRTSLITGNTVASVEGLEYNTETHQLKYTFVAQGTELYVMPVDHGTTAGHKKAYYGDITLVDEKGGTVYRSERVTDSAGTSTDLKMVDKNGNATLFTWETSKYKKEQYITFLTDDGNGNNPQTYGFFGAGDVEVEQYADEWNKVKVVMLKNYGVAPAAGAFNGGEAATETEEAKLSTRWHSLVALDIYSNADFFSLGTAYSGSATYFQNHLVANSETLKYLSLPKRMGSSPNVRNCFYNLPNLEYAGVMYRTYYGYTEGIFKDTQIPEFVLNKAFGTGDNRFNMAITTGNKALTGVNTVSIITADTKFTFARGAAWALAELNKAVNSGLADDDAITAAKASLVARAWNADVEACFNEMLLSISGNRATVSYRGNTAQAKLVKPIEEGVPQAHMVEGASVRYKEGSSGLRFTSQLYIENFDNIAEIGTIIVPTDYVARAGAFTLEALNELGKTFLVIKQDLDKPVWGVGTDAENNWYVMQTAMTNINPNNYNRGFSARTYIKMDDDTVIYADYIAADSCRSVKYVAKTLLDNDMVTDEDKVTVLKEFVGLEAAE